MIQVSSLKVVRNEKNGNFVYIYCDGFMSVYCNNRFLKPDLYTPAKDSVAVGVVSHSRTHNKRIADP